MIGSKLISRVAVAAVAMAVLAVSTPALAVGGEGEGWPSFNESDGCGSPWAVGPNVETSGTLDPDTVLRGPQAAYFGRTIGEVADALVEWPVPMSDGEVLRVHPRSLPSLEQVAVSLAEAEQRGWVYDIYSDQTFGYTARTVGGRNRVSQHGFGNAIDINSRSNPSIEGSVVTDMPPWFVDAWVDAGFCWGGDWVDQSDAMHFSWRGPKFTSGIDRLPEMYPPLTNEADFSRILYRSAVPDPLVSPRFEVLMDADGDAAVDVVSVIDRGGPTVIEVVPARSGYAACATERFVIPEPIEGTAAIPGDWDADGITDLWIIDDTGDIAGIVIRPLLRRDGFTSGAPVTVDVPAGDRYLSGDFDVDGWSDLYILRRVDDGWSLEIRSGRDRFASTLATAFLPSDTASLFTVVDRDLDQVPDLVALGPSGMSIFDGASGFLVAALDGVDVVDASDIAGTDFDGDGRHDLMALADGALTVYAGNTPLDGVEPGTWFQSPDFECGDARERPTGK